MAQVALLDADVIVYLASVVGQQDIDWGDGLEGMTVDPELVLEEARKLVIDWTKKAGCKTPILCFSSRETQNFRKSILPSYKMNRKGPKPEAYWQVADSLEKEFKTFRIEGLEGDDIIGIAITQDRFRDAVAVSTDKDMQTLPGLIFNPKQDRKPRRIRPQLADYYWMYQTLIGDSTDGYKGCPGVGPVKAEKVLTDAGLFFPAMWKAVVSTYESKDLTEDDAITQARAARILRSSDYNREKKEVCLWHPVKPRWISLASLPKVTSVPSSSESTPARSKAESPKSQKSSVPKKGRSRSSSQPR